MSYEYPHIKGRVQASGMVEELVEGDFVAFEEEQYVYLVNDIDVNTGEIWVQNTKHGAINPYAPEGEQKFTFFLGEPCMIYRLEGPEIREYDSYGFKLFSGEAADLDAEAYLNEMLREGYSLVKIEHIAGVIEVVVKIVKKEEIEDE